MAYTPRTFRLGNRTEVANSFDEETQLRWDGWTPDDGVPYTPPPAFSEAELAELRAASGTYTGSRTWTGTHNFDAPVDFDSTVDFSGATVSGLPGGAVVDASTTAKGVVELATASETTTGTDTARAVTPAGVKAVADALSAATAAQLASLTSALSAKVTVSSAPLTASAVLTSSPFDTAPPSPGRTFASALVSSVSDQAHTVVAQHSADGTTWTTLTTLTPTLSGSDYAVAQTLALTQRYLRLVLTNGSTTQTRLITQVVFS